MCRLIMSGTLGSEVPLFIEQLKIYSAAEIIQYLHLSCKAKKATVNYSATKDLSGRLNQLTRKSFSSAITIYENLSYNYSTSYSYNSVLIFCNLVLKFSFCFVSK